MTRCLWVEIQQIQKILMAMSILVLLILLATVLVLCSRAELEMQLQEVGALRVLMALETTTVFLTCSKSHRESMKKYEE